MRLKKTKYIAFLLCSMLFGQLVFSRGFAFPQKPANGSEQAISSLSDDSLTPARVLSGTPVPERAPERLLSDTSAGAAASDSVAPDSLLHAGLPFGQGPDSAASDTTVYKPFLDDPISGTNADSLIYDVKNKVVYIYEKGDVKYQDKNLKADYMRVDMNNKEIYAYGREDTVVGKPTRPEFVDGASAYQMDTITYNIETEKARIKGVTTQDGEGYLKGARVKKMKDNTINIADGKFTTCDADHPHFYLAMTKAKTIPGKKVIVGPSYLVLEDVPLYPLMLPFGFFPTMSGRRSGFIIPTWGEEVVKGFFMRNGGYYFAFNDYIDMTVMGGIYTLGSWEASLASRYIKRYKYSGVLNFRFSKDILGEKGQQDYQNMNNYQIQWTHQKDPKASPNSTFSASVNFSSSGYTKYGSQTMSEYLNTQTNSSISYSKTWAGKPFSFSTNMQHSQNSSDTTVSLSFPNVVFNVSRIFPFKRKNAPGKERWYEKISTQYTGTLGNNVTVKEKDLFTENMFKQMKNGVNHVIPVSTTLNILKYLNVSPSFNYQERWYFQKIDQAWDPVAKRAVNSDTTSGFYRLWDYRFAISATTKIYGMIEYKKKKDGTPRLINAIRHVLTPNVSFSYRPDFADDKYGYYKYVQSDTMGTMKRYSPFQNGLYGVPGAGKNMSMSFGLTQTVEMKVRDRSDTSGVRKIKLIDNLSITSAYNFLADSLNLSPFSINLRTNVFKGLGLNISATLDPYEVDAQGRRINKFMLRRGKLGRLSNVSTSFGYSFQNTNNPGGAVNDITSGGVPPPEYTDMFNQPGFNDMDPNLRRQMMTSTYYDFNIPWNLGLNYSFSYTNNGLRKNVVQSLGFNASVNLTQKWGVTFNGGYDFQAKKLTPGTFTLTRDLHCWQMTFNWVPIGFRRSWSFTINVKSGMLKDLKWDRNSSFYDNLYDN